MQDRVKSKTKVTLEIDATLADAAAAKGLDLAAVLEQALRSHARDAAGQGLSADDLAAMEFHRRYEEEHGSWIVDWRKL